MRRSNSPLVIHFAARPTQLGVVFAATTERGICMLHLIEPKEFTATVTELQRWYPKATLKEDDRGVADVFRQVDRWLNGDRATTPPLDLSGTPFQLKVWRALQRIPAGTTVTYSELARRAGFPKAVRATATACARNPVALFVPCHRIVRRDGLGGYGGGGVVCKRRLLEREGVFTSV
jgi:AraC family transcriptional regulator of adaptative response/methylated-DNA-[protein]-cysteine methyltransferase